jgi:sugar phosphate isomerase/epimerase
VTTPHDEEAPMTKDPRPMSRRSLLHLAAAAPLAAGLAHAAPKEKAKKKGKRIPVGLELYSVRDDEAKDQLATLRAVAAMGYEGVEFWAPYLEWTTDYAKQVRKLLDELKLRAFSTHNRAGYFTPETLKKAIELNQIIGSRYIVMADPGKPEGLDDWKRVADTLTNTAETLRPLGLRAAFHNLVKDWREIDGQRPIDLLAARTPKDVAFQVDTATCLAAGGDPIAFTRANPGRVKSYHLKDWSPDKEKGYKVLLGEGIGPWKELLEVAEATGGVEYYLIEQEGSRYPQMETAKRCLGSLKAIRGA